MKMTRNENPKYEIPNYKQIPNSNFPIFKTAGVSRLRFVSCNLMLVWDFGFDFCYFIKFSVFSVPSRFDKLTVPSEVEGVAKNLCLPCVAEGEVGWPKVLIC
jgi:hypothetical protein